MEFYIKDIYGNAYKIKTKHNYLVSYKTVKPNLNIFLSRPDYRDSYVQINGAQTYFFDKWKIR